MLENNRKRWTIRQFQRLRLDQINAKTTTDHENHLSIDGMYRQKEVHQMIAVHKTDEFPVHGNWSCQTSL
jgi:hypothetical protein